MANPLIRPHIRFYPEDAGSRLTETWQASRWLHELPSDILTPMVRIGAQDFYIYEPAKLWDGQVVVPFRWFTRCTSNANRTPSLFGRGWRTQISDDNSGYIVHEFETVVFDTSILTISFPLMVDTHCTDMIPDPRHINGTSFSF